MSLLGKPPIKEPVLSNQTGFFMLIRNFLELQQLVTKCDLCLRATLPTFTMTFLGERI